MLARRPTPTPLVVALAVALAGALLAAASASAHDGVAGRIDVLSARIAKNPADAEILIQRAELYRLARDWTRAAADLDRAATIAPSLTAIHLARAHLFADTGRFVSAADAASLVLAREPGHMDARLVRARVRARLHQGRDAVADYTRVLDDRPLPDLYIERARAASAGRGADLAAVLNGLDEGIRRLGPLVTLELEAIEIERRLKRYDAALARLDRVSTQAARQDVWLARRGEILEQAGRPADARTAYEAAFAAATSPSAARRRSPASTALVEQLRASLARLGTTSTLRHEGTQ